MVCFNVRKSITLNSRFMKNSVSRIISGALCAMFLSVSFAGFAQETQKKVKDHRTNPDLFYLQEGDLPDSYTILPAPPDAASLQFLYDQARYNWGKTMRNTERGAQAAADARVEGDGVPRAFSEAFGTLISQENTPEIYTLIVNMREDAGDLATRSAKNYYNRQRPFSFYGEDTCNTEQQAELSTNGSYPSGHTTIGWATALVLAEINPERQNEILDRGFQMGESRVICGYHYQSDVDAGRLTGAMAVARLHADPSFQKQLKKAKAEFKKLQKAGKIEAGTPVPTPVNVE